jgi:hypothetical protein
MSARCPMSRKMPDAHKMWARGIGTMSYCEHCEGQRFDRARVLRALRKVRQELRAGNCPTPDGALELALQAVKALEVPHLEWDDDPGPIVH